VGQMLPEAWVSATGLCHNHSSLGTQLLPYLVLTLVPERLRGQVIDGQGSIQVANSSQRHPGQQAALERFVRP
jgi:hypothetical protein